MFISQGRWLKNMVDTSRNTFNLAKKKKKNSGWMDPKRTGNNTAVLKNLYKYIKISRSDKPSEPWGFKPETAHLGRNWFRCECLPIENVAQNSLMEAVKFYFALKPPACAWVSVKTLSKSFSVHLAVQHPRFAYRRLQMDFVKHLALK